MVTSNKDKDLVQRHNPASGVHVQLDHATIVLLTITTEKRLPWLADESAHKLLHETWQAAKAWLVGDYLLMPDHLHLFCGPSDLKFSIEKWIAYWKRQFAIKHGREDWKFQSRGWHHRLRVGESYLAKWRYVQENPVRKGLSATVADWPFKGRVFDLRWTGD